MHKKNVVIMKTAREIHNGNKNRLNLPLHKWLGWSVRLILSGFCWSMYGGRLLAWFIGLWLAKELMTAEEYAAVLTGTKQYVMLGSGLDTFAFREKEFLSKDRVFEVDHPLTQKDKIERITRAGWTIPDNLTFVPADCTKVNVAERLIDGG